jgi:hypothetical protein
MSEVFYTQFMVDLNDFDRMMQEDDMKKYFKQRLAIELAHQLIESNRTQYTYIRVHDRDAIRLSARIEL